MRKRLKRTTEITANGTKVQRAKLVDAPVLEWRLQASSVRALKALPEFDRTFTLAGDMNAAKRGPQDQIRAKATGLAPGDPDLRIYGMGGRLWLIEFKAAKGRLSPAQVDRHALLKRLGFDVVTLQATTEEEAAEATVELVRAWLAGAANDNAVEAVAARGGEPVAA